MENKYNNLPQKLKENGLFCCWRLEKRNGKETKVPYNARTGGRARANKKEDFTNFETALKAVKNYDGLGVGIFGGLCAIDIDNCLDNGSISELATDIVSIMNCYTEYSPSGKGLHLYFTVDGDFKFDNQKYYINNRKIGVEVYVANATNKYLTVTGNGYDFWAFDNLENRTEQLKRVLDKYMRKPQTEQIQIKKEATGLSDDEVISVIMSSKQCFKFNSLFYEGDISAYNNDDSAADMALCSMLAFYCGYEPEQIDRLFRQSALMRDKWEREDYRTGTILKSINTAKAVYEPKGKKADKPLNIITFDKIKEEYVSWLVFPYIPLGRITLLQGNPGTGKTMWAAMLAAKISTGEPFPTESFKKEPLRVLFQSAEDGAGDTIKPRLRRAGADMKNIALIQESMNEQVSFQKIEQLRGAMEQFKPSLAIFDPIQAFIGAGVDMYRPNEMRPIMKDLAMLAEEFNCSILPIIHMSKMTKASALHRGLGSIDIVGAARSLLVLGNDPINNNNIILSHAKSNLAQKGDSLVYTFGEGGALEFICFSDLEADDIVNPPQKRKKQSVTLNEAKILLEDMLNEKGFANREDIFKEAETQGISRATIYRAKNELELKQLQTGFGRNKKAIWYKDGADIKP